jgi:hypothetical protein
MLVSPLEIYADCAPNSLELSGPFETHTFRAKDEALIQIDFRLLKHEPLQL